MDEEMFTREEVSKIIDAIDSVLGSLGYETVGYEDDDLMLSVLIKRTKNNRKLVLT